MGGFSFFGQGIPGIEPQDLRGKLIVIEGADGVGRSSQVWLLKQWLENNGHAVLATRMTRSSLAGKGLREAKKGTTLGRVTMTLFYATDFADRLEHEVIPALKAGFIVLTDRYIYTLIARALVRGIDADWIREVYGFALKPDRVFYLRAEVDDLVTRVLQEGGFDYWESGMDLRLGDDFCRLARTLQRTAEDSIKRERESFQAFRLPLDSLDPLWRQRPRAIVSGRAGGAVGGNAMTHEV